MNNVYLSIGSNLGNRIGYIQSAANELEKNNCPILQKSPVYETQPVGPVEQGDFLNCIFHIQTECGPEELLRLIKSIELSIGREKRVHWGPREIDIDIVLFEGKIFDSKDLTIPHPEMCKREFVLKPLNDIGSDLVHPIEGKTIGILLERYYEETGNDRRLARVLK